MGDLMIKLRAVGLCALLISGPVGASKAQDVAKTDAAVVNEDAGVPVFAYNITDRPYKVLGEVTAGVRKATVFSKEASQAKVYRILWKNAKHLGADAVINAKYGDSHISAFSWGKTNATGTAIKFTGPAAAAATPAPTK